MTNQPEKSVDEIVEEFRQGDEFTSVAPADWNDENVKGYLQAKKEIEPWLTQTLTAERQRCEEMVEEAEKRGAENILKYIGTRFEDNEMASIIRKELGITFANNTK